MTTKTGQKAKKPGARRINALAAQRLEQLAQKQLWRVPARPVRALSIERRERLEAMQARDKVLATRRPTESVVSRIDKAMDRICVLAVLGKRRSLRSAQVHLDMQRMTRDCPDILDAMPRTAAVGPALRAYDRCHRLLGRLVLRWAEAEAIREMEADAV